MRHIRLIVLVCFALAVTIVPTAEAQLSEEYSGWADGPEGLLLTKKENKEWAKITTDAAAERFIELFWARRNPEPDNPFNAFKAEFDAKVLFADENLGYGKTRGSLTDRGRVLILMGRPDGRDLQGASQANISGSDTVVDGRTDTWVYDTEKLAKEFKAKGSQLFFLFYEERLDTNNFNLDRTNRESFKAISALGRAPDVYLLHPDLMEVPKPISIAGASPASAAHLAWFAEDEAPFDDVVIVISELGVNDGVSRPLWVHFELPPDAPELDLLAGRVSSDDGVVISNFEIAATPVQGQYGSVYHLSFPLDEGSYTIEIVGAAGGEPQLTQSIEAEVAAIPGDGTWMSPIWLGTAASPNPEARLGDAFTFGGWHLTPISGPELTKAAEIAYFGFFVRPAFNEDGLVELKARVRLKRDGKPLGQPLTMPLNSSQIIGDLYMYGNSIALSALPEIGSYEFEFEITETNSDSSTERTVSLEVTE